MTSHNKPDFFIVGAPKCGTTSLCHYLNQHPEIFISDEKEPNFFNEDIVKYDRSIEEYLGYFADHNHQFCGEGSAWYLYSSHAAQSIKAFNPNAKIIIALRNPVSLVESLHSEHMICGYETISDLSQAIQAEHLRDTGELSVRSTMLKQRWYCQDWYRYRKVACFSDQIKRYLDCFDPGNIHVVVFDDLKQDTASEYKRLLQFIGVEDIDFQPDFEIKRSNLEISLPVLYRFFAAPPDGFVRLIQTITPRMLRPIIRKLGWRVIGYAKQALTRPKPRKPADPKLRAELKQYFAEDLKQLSQLLNRDFGHWSSRSSD